MVGHRDPADQLLVPDDVVGVQQVTQLREVVAGRRPTTDNRDLSSGRGRARNARGRRSGGTVPGNDDGKQGQ